VFYPGTDTNPYTCIFNPAFEDAYDRLTGNETCCKFFGPGAVDTLQRARWSFQALGRPIKLANGGYSSVGASTFPEGLGAVFINSQGPFINPTHTLVLAPGRPFVDLSGGMSDVDARALIILHELGHLTGMFGPDTGKFAYYNKFFTGLVRTNCFQ
jgi:hypothetical protein